MGRIARDVAAVALVVLAACSGGGSSSPRPACTTATDCGAAANGAYACTDGACTLAACDPGFADCDTSPGDGCEAALATDAANCGACGNACAAGKACVAGACTSACTTPGAPCDFDGGQVCDLDLACVPASVVVVQVGDQSAALSPTATAVFLRRFDIFGTEVGSPIALPTAVSGANQPLTLSGTATSEGALSRSADHRYLVLAGYGAAPGTTVTSATSAAVNRVVGRIDASGTVDTTTALSDAYSQGNVRGAASADGTSFWVTGNAVSTGGVRYAALGGTGSTQVLATPSNTRTCQVSGGQLYCDSGSSTWANVFTVGTGLPTTAGQAASVLPGMPISPTTTPSPYGFVLLDRSPAVPGADTLYVADDRSLANGGGVQKWTFDGATWSLATTFANGLTTGVRGLTGFVVNGNVQLVATDASHVVTLLDDGSSDPPFAVLANAPANTAFRGVAPMPNP